MSPKRNEAKILAVISAWETLRPAKTYAGLTLTQFKEAVQGALNARAALNTLENQLLAAQNQRDDQDKVALGVIALVVNAVKGDPDDGEDGELYEAMGYVRKSERSSGLHRGKQPPANPA
jgi:hypothetical protein